MFLNLFILCVSTWYMTIQSTLIKKMETRKRMATKEPRSRVSTSSKPIQPSNTNYFVSKRPATFLNRSFPSG